MTTERDVPLLPSDSADVPLPERVRDFEERIKVHRAALAETLGIFRKVFHEFARGWIRDHAKRIAVAQNAHTLEMKRDEIARLKEAVEEHGASLRRAIDEEFTAARYGEAESVSSGQIGQLVRRRFEGGMRKVLATIGPVLERAGYVRDENWIEPDPDSPRARFAPQTIELPAELHRILGQVKDCLIDIKVAEAKISYFEQQREKEKAAELWETS
jgi:hypothetical protein